MISSRVFPIPVRGIPDFWKRLQSARASFLVLDYDGTVAPFQVARMEAYPMAGIPDLIARIRNRTSGGIAVASGRPIAEIEKLLGVPGIMTIGSHGCEFHDSDGTLEIRKPSQIQREGLGKALETGIRRGIKDQLEVKAASIALHTRGQVDDEALSMEKWAVDSWTPIARLHNLEVRGFNGGVELRCTGLDKGSALQILLARQPEDAFCVYLGDDETDEDAFRVLLGRGIGIKVGNADVPTTAAGFLPDIEAVKDFLEGWDALAPEGHQED